MALAIAIEGKGVIANADGYTDSATSGSTWNEDGAGTDSFTIATFLFGSTSFAGLYSNKAGFQYFDIGSGNELDFTPTTGTEKDQFVYIWIMCRTIGVTDTISNKGLAIRIGTDLSNYREYIVGGSDDSNGWTGGWKCFVVDPTKQGSVNDTGTFDISSVRYFGVYISNVQLEAGDSIFIDQIAVGKGLRITGTSTQGWEDVVDYCTAYGSRAWGMFTEKDGIYFAQGKIFIGSTTQEVPTSFKDSGRIIQWAKSEYYSGEWVTSYPINACGIVVEDSSSASGETGETYFEDGILVGTNNGRAGSQFIGNDILDVSLDLYGGNDAGSTTKLYNTTFRDLTGTIVWGNNANHLFYGGVVNSCEQFNPVGAPKIRNCTFSETIHADGCLLWNENIDMESCNFIANTIGAAIEMPSAVGTPYVYTGLQFAGNTVDIHNSSGSPITVTCSDSNAQSYSGETVTITNTKYHRVTNVQQNSEVTYISGEGDAATILAHEENVGSDGISQYDYNYAGDFEVDILIMHLNYEPYQQTVILSDSDTIFPVSQVYDRNYSNP